MNGNDWQYNKCDGSWEILSVLPISEFTDIVMETYDKTFTNDNLKVCKCTAQMEEPSGIMSTTIQNDTRANANITSDFSLLEHLQWVEPVKCNSAKKGAELEIQAIGKYKICGTLLQINMFYCPDANGTIVSPTAAV